MPATPSHETGIISGINITPLVDITLVLLIIFIVTAKLIVTPAVPLELPRASQTEELQVVFSISVSATGATLVNGQRVTDDRAIARLAKVAFENNPSLRVVIAADGAVPHRRVIELLDQIRGTGIARVAFGALPPEPANP